MKRYKLVEGQWTNGQLAVAALWGANLFAVLLLWATTSGANFSQGIYGVLLALGQLAGLLATYFALVQFILLGRVPWIEKQFGLDRLTHFHRLNGYATITALLIHPILIIGAYSIASRNNFVAQYLEAVTSFPYVWMALISEILFIAVVFTSVYIVRRHLKFESWYFVHLLVYGAIVLAFFHQFALGGSLNGHPLARTFWYALYAFVALNVLFYRFSWPTIKLLRFRYRVSRVVPETPTSTSVYIQGRNLDKWRVQAGQYVLVRIFARGLWWQEHPFSVSRLPENNEFRLTIRNVGDYTSAIRDLQPGAYVLVSGPFGRFTRSVARTDKRLFIAGGVGITPVRTLAEEAVQAGQDSVLLYGSRIQEDVVLKSEIDALSAQGLKTTHIFSESAGGKDETGSINGQRIRKLVPDFLERDIYLCGPPAMMESIIDDLANLGVQAERLHYERFALHN